MLNLNQKTSWSPWPPLIWLPLISLIGAFCMIFALYVGGRSEAKRTCGGSVSVSIWHSQCPRGYMQFTADESGKNMCCTWSECAEVTWTWNEK